MTHDLPCMCADLSARLGLGKKLLLDVPRDLRDLFLADSEAESGYALMVPAFHEVVALMDRAIQTEPEVQVRKRNNILV